MTESDKYERVAHEVGECYRLIEVGSSIQGMAAILRRELPAMEWVDGPPPSKPGLYMLHCRFVDDGRKGDERFTELSVKAGGYPWSDEECGEIIEHWAVPLPAPPAPPAEPRLFKCVLPDGRRPYYGVLQNGNATLIDVDGFCLQQGTWEEIKSDYTDFEWLDQPARSNA